MSNSLRALAQKAKLRLKAISNDKQYEEENENVHRSYSEACLSARIQYAIIATQKRVQDDPLYGKIKRMILKDSDITNPLSVIIEHNIYDNLSASQKEKYMYKLSKRYVEIKNHVLKEIEEEKVSSI